VPITVAVSLRARPARRSAAIAGLLIPAGVAVAALALAERENALLMIAGTLTTICGVLFIRPVGGGDQAPFDRGGRTCLDSGGRDRTGGGLACDGIDSLR
jgi:hypothetical protein